MEEKGKRGRRISTWTIVAGLALALVCLAAVSAIFMLSMGGGAALEEPTSEETPAATMPKDTPTAMALATPSPLPTSTPPETLTAAFLPSSTPPRTPTGESTPTNTPQRTPTVVFLPTGPPPGTRTAGPMPTMPPGTATAASLPTGPPPGTPTAEPMPTMPPGTATAKPVPSSTPPGTATAVLSPTPAGETLEVTGDSQVSEADRLGELDVNYPVRMSPGSSDIVRLSIQIPERLVSLAPMSVERVVLSPGSQPAIGEVSSDQATIIIGRVMRVEVSSPTFAVASEYPAVQAVDVETIGSPTFWAWTVVAPDRVGNHILTVRVFLGEETAQPSWMRAYQVEVLDAPSSAATLPTPGSGPTPMPTAAPALSERIKEGVLENVVEILISIVSLLISGMAWLFGVGYRAQKKRTKKVTSLQKELAKAAAEEREALAKEIAQLEAVRWWQFCKWGE